MSPRFLAALSCDLDLDCLIYHQIHELIETLLCKLAAKLLMKVTVYMPYPNLTLYPDSELLEEPYGDG